MEFNYDLNDPPPSDNDEPDGRRYSDIYDVGNFFSRTNRTERANRLRAWGFRIPNLPVALVEQNLQLRGDQPAIHSVSVAPVEQNLQLWGDRLMSIPVPVAPVEQNLQLWGDRLMTTIPVPVAPVEQNLQPQPEPIDVVEVDSEEEEEEDEDDGDEFYDYLIDEEDDDVEEVVAAAVNDEIIISSSSTVGQASSSRTTHGRSPLNGSGSAQIADNQQRDKRRRGDPQQVVNVHNINARLQELIAPPPTQASTEVCPTCKGASGASSSKPKPVAVPPPPPPPPTYKCPICMGPLVDPVVPVCGHMFCRECLTAAIAVKPRCPLCRFTVYPMEFISIYFPTCD